jgi:hypothetical protein
LAEDYLSYRIKEDEWMAHGAGIVEVRNAYKILVLQSEPKKPFGALR